MIRHTFSILDGAGEKTEKRLWENGITSWDDFLDSDSVPFISSDNKILYDAMLGQYKEDLHNKNEKIFVRDIKKTEHWRFFEIFSGNAVCLDIETNGMAASAGGYPTVVGFYNGFEYKSLVMHEDLTWENIYNELSSYKYLITFYGSVFDMPFLFKRYPQLKDSLLHFDLCIAARRLGIKGGLKKLEQSLNIIRDDDIIGMNGFDAVKLWSNYKHGNSESLETLIKYNRDDTVNLFYLAEHIYGKLKESSGIKAYL
jgi:hypothetical protein